MGALADDDLTHVSKHLILSGEMNEVLTKMDNAFDQVIVRVEQELLDQADYCTSNKEKQLLRDAYYSLKIKRSEVKNRFKQAFHDLVQKGMSVRNDLTQDIPKLDDIDWNTLSLIDDASVNEDVLVSRLASKIRNDAESELFDLNTRMSYLRGHDEPDENNNPLRPETFGRALGQACDAIEADHAMRMEILRVFERAMSERVAAVYHDLNARLIERKVLPKIKLRTPPKPSNQSPRPANAESNGDGAAAGTTGNYGADGVEGMGGGVANGNGGAGGGAGPTMQDVVQNTLNMFEVLQSLVAQTPAFQQMMEANPVVAQTRRHLYNAIHELREYHVIDINEDVMAQVQALPQFAPLGDVMPNQIWANREQLQAAAGSPIDRITIDIVAMLFDQILADESLPNDIKLWLGRLQMPVLRVALADPAFFAQRTHPARRLIDRMASCGLGYDRDDNDGQGGSNQRFLEEVKRIVQTVLRSTEDDTALYETLLQEFEVFLTKEAQQDDNQIVARAADLLERAEVREVLGINATIQINQLLLGVEIDPYIRSFLLDTWSQVIAEAATMASDYPDGADQEPEVVAYRDVVKDLVWSIQPKVTDVERRALVQALPKLLSRLRQGLQLINFPQDKETRFLSLLMQIHSTVARTVVSDNKPKIDMQKFSNQVERLGFGKNVDVSVLAHDQIKIPLEIAERLMQGQQLPVEIVQPQPIPENTISVDAETVERWVNSLERGNWVEIKQDSGFVKAQLMWISPMRSFFLFSTDQSKRGHSMDPATLRNCFQRGTVRLVEGESLIGRSVRGVMDQLEKNPNGVIPPNVFKAVEAAANAASANSTLH